MTAKIIASCNQKGGCGKSLICMSISGELGERGFRVLVVDADNQNTATMWSAAAPDDTPFPAAVLSLAAYGSKLHREVQKHLDNYDYIIIDCPPSVDALATQSALLVANLAIVPIPPSPADLWSSRGIKVLIERAQGINEGLKAVILVNKLQRTALSKAVLAELANFGLPVLKTKLSARTAYQEAVISGSTVASLGRAAKPAADEVRSLVDEVIAILGDES